MLTLRNPLTTLALILLFFGCSDPLPETRHKVSSLTGADGGAAPDLTAPTGCSATCQAGGAHLCVTDNAKGRCVECTTDAHCAGNPGSFGDTCDPTFGICLCKGAAGCSGKTPGGRCISTPFSPLCGCQTDGDCSAPQKCLGQAFGIRVCQAACTADSDCNAPALPMCQTKTGACVACKNDTECTSPYAPTCSASLGRCVACTQDGHCTEAGLPRCDLTRGACEACTSDDQCPGASGKGSLCKLSTTGLKRCRCDTDANCVGNKFGPTCDTLSGQCACTKDSQCSAPLSRCVAPFFGAARKQCAGTCEENKDCGLGLRCLITIGKVCGECNKDAHCTNGVRDKCDSKAFACLECKADTDCKGETPRCDKATGSCVACATNTDCVGHLSGPICKGGLCSCSDNKDCTAPGVWGDRCISYGGVTRCGCATNSGCTGNNNGPVCYMTVGKCSCGNEGVCKAGVTTCRAPYAGAKYKACTKLCKTDKDCPATESPHCEVGTGLCLPCLNDAHCAATPWEKRCDTTSARCVECVTDAHCTTKTLGKVCTGGVCLCKNDTQCKGNDNGSVCDTLYKSCSCTKDTDCAGAKKCTVSKLGQKIKLCQ